MLPHMSPENMEMLKVVYNQYASERTIDCGWKSERGLRLSSVLMLETQAFRPCHLSAPRHSAITALFIAEYTICAGLETFRTAKSRRSVRSFFPSPCRAHVQSLFAFHSTI